MPAPNSSSTTELSVATRKYYGYPSTEASNSAEIADEDLKLTDGTSTTVMGTDCAIRVGEIYDKNDGKDRPNSDSKQLGCKSYGTLYFPH